MKANDNKRGFGLVGVLVVAVILAAIGVIGWYVYSKNSKQNSLPQNAQKSITNFDECVAAGNPVMESDPEQCSANGQTFVNDKQKSQQQTQDETANWLLYESPGKEYKMRLPDGWVVYRYQKSSGLYVDGIDETTYKAGTKAKVVEVDGGRDFDSLAFGLSLLKSSEASYPIGVKQKTFKTSQGLEVTLYAYEHTTDPEVMGPPKGTKSYSYYIYKGDDVVIISHDVRIGEQEQTAIIEKAIATLEIN